MSSARASGILLHPTSLPGRYGIGDLGGEAYRFANVLADMQQRLWQVLPLGPTGYGNSPYQCLSVFAGNPLLVSPEKLAEEGFLESCDLHSAPPYPDHSVDYDSVIRFKLPLLKKSCDRFLAAAGSAQHEEFDAFCQQNALWLEDFSLFMALKEHRGLSAWNTWEEEVRTRRPEALESWRRKLDHEIRCHKYRQFQFFRQWRELKDYCNQGGMKLIGDMPIFVALDSAEVWSRPDLFHLDERCMPTVVAGVPPDYFSETGQLWGNPIYRWDVMARDGYAWWIERFRALHALVDIVRVDHFRGFESYWEVPAADKTAINGRWVPGPGAELFRAVQQALGDLPVIAEDLGLITPEVDALRDDLGLPGMRVLQFAFGGDAKADEYKPHNYPRNCVVYTGTHDNNTTVGWFRDEGAEDTTQTAEERRKEREMAMKYVGSDGQDIHWDLIRLALMSVADTAIIPMQDVLGLGSEARMNRPGTAQGNWRWRFSFDMLTDDIKNRLRDLTTRSRRAEA